MLRKQKPESLVGRCVFGYENGLLEKGPSVICPGFLPPSLVQVSSSYDSADMINALAIQGDAGEGDVGMHAKDLSTVSPDQRQHYRARRHIS